MCPVNLCALHALRGNKRRCAGGRRYSKRYRCRFAVDKVTNAAVPAAGAIPSAIAAVSPLTR
jgi:hypothetical protein